MNGTEGTEGSCDAAVADFESGASAANLELTSDVHSRPSVSVVLESAPQFNRIFSVGTKSEHRTT